MNVWMTKNGEKIEVNMTAFNPQSTDKGTVYEASFIGPKGNSSSFKINDGGNIIFVDDGIEAITGFKTSDLLGTSFYSAPLYDRQRDPGIPAVTNHWRPQFAFPIQNVPDESLKETVYYIDYQGVRFISLDSNKAKEMQVPGLEEYWKIIQIDGLLLHFIILYFLQDLTEITRSSVNYGSLSLMNIKLI